MLFRAEDYVRTYSIPVTVCGVSQSALERNKVLAAVRLNDKMKDASVEPFIRSSANIFVCATEMKNID